jgi:two-component system chemotaxis response regulator CheY
MRRVLIIDDSHLIRRVARAYLERMRFDVVEAEAVPEAIERCKERMPDVILLDWHLPTISAFDFLAALRPLIAGAKPFIVYCTTENDPIDITKAMNAGADDYLLKPFDRSDIEAKFAQIPVAA